MRTKIKKYLESKGAKCEVKHNSRFAKTGEPDLYGCFCGRAFVFEVKLKDGKPTKLQKYRLTQWRKAGAVTGVVRSEREAWMCVSSSEKRYGY